MRRLEVGDKIDIIRNGELQSVLTVEKVTETIAQAIARSGYVARYKRAFDGDIIINADPMADNGYFHSGQPPEHFQSEQSKSRYYDKIKELGAI